MCDRPVTMTMRELFLETVTLYRGRWYKWGGDDPSGFDCSGLVVEGLKTCGKLARKIDRTARGLYNDLSTSGKATDGIGVPGSLVFWTDTSDASGIRHVEVVYAIIDGTPFSIGASGGGSKTHTEADAIAQNAFIKVRPVYGRGGLTLFADPFI